MPVTNPTASTLSCGACRHTNSSDAQFCGGCGHSLYENCVKCNGPVTLSQKFCVACGQDLSKWLQQRLSSQESKLAEAVALTKRFEFERAISVLNLAGNEEDYRYATIARRATLAKEKVALLQQRFVADAQAKIAAAKLSYQNGDRHAALQTLADVPDQLLDETSRTIKQECRAHLDQLAWLRADLQKCLAEKTYAPAACVLHQLLDLEPDDARYRKMATQISGKILHRAERFFERQEYAAAGKLMAAVPETFRDPTFENLHQRIKLTHWLSQQLIVEPYVTQSTGRLAMRLAKEVPADKEASQMVKKMQAVAKSSRPSPRDAHAAWRTDATGWLGGRVAVLANPESIQLPDLPNRPTSLSPYAVAIGLALQGLGQTRVTGNLIPRKGLILTLAFGKNKPVWGVDVGSSAIHAVQMRIDKSGQPPRIEKIISVDLKSPISRGGNPRGAAEFIPEAIGRLLEQIDVHGSTVFANLPACDGISRFCQLPPVKDKDADRLIEAEVRQRIPIAADDLALLTWRAPLVEESLIGRPATMVAATPITVKQRVDLLAVGGLRIDGLIPEPIALANFAAHEFDAWFSSEADSGFEAGRLPTIAMVDAGASKVTLAMISPVAIWFWSYENGGEDVTAAVARQTKQTAKDAEQTKRNLAAVANPEDLDEVIAAKQDLVKSRLKKLAEEAHKTFPHFDVRQTWCVGRGHLQHGFLRRVLMNEVGY